MAGGCLSLQLFGCLTLLNTLVSVSGKFSVLGPEFPVIVTFGSDADLTCRLLPAADLRDLEVKWTSTRYNSILSLYRGRRELDVWQIPQYQGRTQLVKDGMETGRVGLRIHSTRLSDDGVYRCFVQSDTFYDDAELELKVTGVGTAPTIHVEYYQDGGIRLLCTSEGWHPEPEVLWRGHGGESVPLSTDHTKTPRKDGLFHVASSLVITGASNQNLSCSVRNPFLNQSKEATIFISDEFFRKISPWTLALSVILTVLVLFISLVICLLVKEHKEKIILSREVAFRRAVMKPESVTMDPDTGNAELVLSEDLKTVIRVDVKQDLPDGPKRFSSARCVLGACGFTAGNHYWEVLVQSDGDWAVGCARESVTRKGLITLTPDDGIWSAGVSGGQYQVLANPRPELFVSRTPQKVGVYLEHERGLLSFYNVDEGLDLIYSFRVCFTERLLPFFWVGCGVEIKICT